MRQAIYLLSQLFALDLLSTAGQAVGDVGAIALTAFQQPLGGQPLVNVEDGVLIHQQRFGKLTNAGQPIARRQSAADAVAANLVCDLARDGYARRCLNSYEQEILR